MEIKPNEIRIKNKFGEIQSILIVHKKEDLKILDDISRMTGFKPDQLDVLLVKRWLKHQNE